MDQDKPQHERATATQQHQYHYCNPQYAYVPQTTYRTQIPPAPRNRLESLPISPRSLPASTTLTNQSSHHDSDFLKHEHASQEQQTCASLPATTAVHDGLSSSSMPLSNFDSSSTFLSNPTPISTLNLAHQHALFLDLERICANAARAYCLSQCESVFDQLGPASRAQRTRHHHCVCGNRPCQSTQSYNVRPSLTREQQQQQEPSLADYLPRIAQKVWERALDSRNHAAELEAVHRMGNLYGWGEIIVGAARAGDHVYSGEQSGCGEGSEEGEVRDGEGGGDGELGESGAWEEKRGYYQEEVFKVVMAARDLASWLLSEEAKKEIDELWEGRLAFG